MCKRRRVKSMQALISRQDRMMRTFWCALRRASADQRTERMRADAEAARGNTHLAIAGRETADLEKVKTRRRSGALCFM